MQIAEKFTYNEQEFGLYMTDVSFDNFAVNEEGKVFIVDAENIIVVDRRQIKEGKNLERKLVWSKYICFKSGVSIDNFAVNDEGRVFIVDTGNIINVDRRQIKEGKTVE